MGEKVMSCNGGPYDDEWKEEHRRILKANYSFPKVEASEVDSRNNYYYIVQSAFHENLSVIGCTRASNAITPNGLPAARRGFEIDFMKYGQVSEKLEVARKADDLFNPYNAENLWLFSVCPEINPELEKTNGANQNVLNGVATSNLSTAELIQRLLASETELGIYAGIHGLNIEYARVNLLLARALQQISVQIFRTVVPQLSGECLDEIGLAPFRRHFLQLQQNSSITGFRNISAKTSALNQYVTNFTEAGNVESPLEKPKIYRNLPPRLQRQSTTFEHIHSQRNFLSPSQSSTTGSNDWFSNYKYKPRASPRLMTEGLGTQSSPNTNNSPIYHRRRGTRLTPYCGFCFRSREPPENYLGHSLFKQNEDGIEIVECPVLRRTSCPICGCEGGDFAHTKRHCKLNQQPESEASSRSSNSYDP